MKRQLRSVARRLLTPSQKRFVRQAVTRLQYESVAVSGMLTSRSAHAAMKAAFAPLASRLSTHGQSVRRMGVEAARLRRLARKTSNDGAGSARVLDALLASSHAAAAAFKPSTLESYVDVSVRVTAIRALAEYVASGRTFEGDALAVTAAIVERAGGDRAALLAHAGLLLDRGRRDEATLHIRRALRIQAVCQTAQELLAKAGHASDYDLSDKFCPMPFTHLSTSFKGDAFTCTCSAWVPYPVGNVIDAPTADAVWNSDAAAEVRRSIHDGDFRYCSRTLCSYIAGRTLPSKSEITDPVLRRYIDERTLVVPDPPAMVQMNHDQSCNLACPSCRTGIVTAGPAEQAVYVDSAERVLLPLMRNMNGMAYISGGGEAFASAHYRKILATLNRRDFPSLYVFLISNGQLLNAKRWAEFPDLPEMIANMSISVDAARADTYERLRRPGKWNVLMENLQLLAEMRASGKLRRLQINFVVQAANFRELPEFIALGDRLGVDSFWLQRVTNYGAYAEPVFAETDVTSPAHPDHAELLAILRQPVMADPRVDADMLRPILPERVAAEDVNPRLRYRMRFETPAVS